MTHFFTNADTIDAYSRADMLADGSLIAVDPELLSNAGIIDTPVALTRAAWENCVAWTEADSNRKGISQDETGRLWNVLGMLRDAIRTQGRKGGRTLFRLRRVSRAGLDAHPRAVLLKVVVHPGDDGERVITVMQPTED